MTLAGGYFGNFDRPIICCAGVSRVSCATPAWLYGVHARFSFKPLILTLGLRNRIMRKGLIAAGLSVAVLAATSTAASADWRHHGYYHRGPGPVLGLVGGIVVGAATIATLPFAILGAAFRPAPPPPDYYGPPGPGYGPPPEAYGPPPPPPPPPRYYYE